MVRRAVSTLSPVLLALAVFFGTAPVGAAGTEASVATWTSGNTAKIVRGSLDQINQDAPDGGVNQRADEDDTPDPVLRFSGTAAWPPVARSHSCGPAPQNAGRTHWPCATPPRAPPVA